MTETLRGGLAIVAAWAAFGLLHSLPAREEAKRAVERLAGPAALAGGYRAAYALLSAAAAVWLWLLPRSLAGDVLLLALPGPAQALAYAVKAGALALIAASFRELRFSEFTGLAQLARWRRGELKGAPPTRPGAYPMAQAPEPLACRGTYLWVRHPLNTGAFLWIWARPAYTAFDVVFALSLTAYVLLGNRLEERDLLRRYGVAYEAYRRTVPAFFGGFRGLAERERRMKEALLTETTRQGGKPR